MAETTSPTRLPPLAILAGIRTPFAKSFGAGNVSRPAQPLPSRPLPRAGIRTADVSEVVFRNVAGQRTPRTSHGDRPPKRHPAAASLTINAAALQDGGSVLGLQI